MGRWVGQGGESEVEMMGSGRDREVYLLEDFRLVGQSHGGGGAQIDAFLSRPAG